MKKLFSERMGQSIPRIKEVLDETVRAALLQLIELRIDDNSFGLKFPVQCPDGHGNSGCDQQALRNNMAGYKVIWPSDAKRLDHEEITDIQIFDLLEYAYEYVAQPLHGGYHSYFSHSHDDYDQEAGRKQQRRGAASGAGVGRDCQIPNHTHLYPFIPDCGNRFGGDHPSAPVWPQSPESKHFVCHRHHLQYG
jgi:hypothetical protein